MSGEFDVDTDEMRAAANDIRAAVANVAGWTMSSGGASATSFGHDQVAQVYVDLCTKLTETVRTTAEGTKRAAADLDTSATTYDATDTATGAVMGGFGLTPGMTP